MSAILICALFIVVIYQGAHFSLSAFLHVTIFRVSKHGRALISLRYCRGRLQISIYPCLQYVYLFAIDLLIPTLKFIESTNVASILITTITAFYIQIILHFCVIYLLRLGQSHCIR